MKLLIDISHIMVWTGNLTGIERAEYHIIRHYFEATDADFVTWNDEAGVFQLIPRDQVEKAIIQRTSEAEQRDAGLAGVKATLLHRAKRKLKRSASPQLELPEGILLVLAGLWDNNNYIEALENLSQNHKLLHIVYDMIPLSKRGFVVDYLPGVFSNYMYRILPKCQAVLAISESTAKDIKDVLKAQNLRVPEIVTFRLGDEISRASTAVRPAAAKDDFILSVGTIEARKNHQLLYYAYKQMAADKQPLPQLVIAGKRGWLTSDFQHLVEHDPDINKLITIIDKATDSELRWLYENALFTVFPSFYEGWGLPVAESLNYGKVTLASNTSSMPEIGGKFAD
ncbi:MAG TPA: glycosyltransferase family 1 protein, partial [Allocoleopsis sp.]